MPAATRPVVLVYDGSEDARHAIAAASELLGGRAVVVHVYATPTPAAAAMAVPGIPVPVDPVVSEKAEQRAQEVARATLDEGVEVARAAGFDATPALAPGDGVHAVWNAIVSIAEQHDASVIVIAHPHLSWLQEKLMGSVDSGVIKHAGRPVLVVPGHGG